jgi:predicted transcriptional regulator
MKRRLSVYLDPALMAQLTELAKRKKQSMSLVAEAAITSLLTPDEDDRREAVIARRLDRIDRRLDRLERDLAVSVEAMALFIRYWLMITPSVPDDFQAVAQAKGRDRFALFLEALGQRLATGRRISNEVSADMRLDSPV